MQVGRTLLAIICLCFLTASCGSKSDPHATNLIKLPKLNRLESLAEKACQCRMAGRDVTRVQTEFNRLKNGLKTEALASASVPLNSSIECYPEFGRSNACVTLSIDIVSPAGAGFVCTNKEYDNLDKIWNAKISPNGSTVDADAALLRQLDSMKKDVAKSVSQTDCDYP